MHAPRVVPSMEAVAQRGEIGQLGEWWEKARRIVGLAGALSHQSGVSRALFTVASHGQLMDRIPEWFVRQPPCNAAARQAPWAIDRPGVSMDNWWTEPRRQRAKCGTEPVWSRTLV
jgi:hypothetical protein